MITVKEYVNYNSGVRIKQEPVMAVRKQINDKKNKRNSNMKAKPCNRCGRVFDQGHLKNCSAMGKTCMNCGKSNHFAKVCRSQQVSEVAEDSEGSVEEHDQIRESFGSCSDFEMMSIQTHQPENERISKYVKDRISGNKKKSNGEMIQVQKIDSIRDPKLKRLKSLKAMLQIDNQIIQLTEYTGSPLFFLNWATAKEIMEKSNKVRLIPSEKLNLYTKFIDYNKQPVCVLGELKTNIRSACWEVTEATFLVTERKTTCIMGLELQRQMGIVPYKNHLQKNLPGLKCSCASSRKVGKINSSKNSEIYLMTRNFKKPHCKFEI